jgi:hypothetical protein
VFLNLKRRDALAQGQVEGFGFILNQSKVFEYEVVGGLDAVSQLLDVEVVYRCNSRGGSVATTDFTLGILGGRDTRVLRVRFL